MAYWLMKSEPDVFGWDDLVAKGVSPWDGVPVRHGAGQELSAVGAAGDRERMAVDLRMGIEESLD